MIQKLRYKFVAVAMAGIGCLFLLILLSINLFMTISSRSQGFHLLSDFAREREHQEQSVQDRTAASAPSGTEEAFFEAAPTEAGPDAPPNRHRPPAYQDALRFFSISYSDDKTVQAVNYNPESELQEKDILAIGERVLNKYTSLREDQGIVQSKYLYLIRRQDTLWQIYFLDYSVEHNMTGRLFYLCLLVGLCGMGILFAAVWFLSGWMIRPVQDAFNRQKQFVADASHELKTPLTILSANADVLSATLSDNKWLGHIQEQVQRMNTLIRELLDLARLDNERNPAEFIAFDCSSCVSAAALSFESLAFETNKSFRMEITEGLQLTGKESAIRQLVTILLDNAFKYTDTNGTITLTLSAKGDKKILSVHNTGKGIAPEDQKHIFERFYRSDNSRSRESGGYGLGLAIASSIVSQHKGQLRVESDGSSYTAFTAVL